MNDMGQFIRNTKIKCGKLLVKSQKQYRMRPRQVPGTPQLTPSYAENFHWHKQNDWPSNWLLRSQMEDTFHAMRQELAILTDKESDKTITQLNQKWENSPDQIISVRWEPETGLSAIWPNIRNARDRSGRVPAGLQINIQPMVPAANDPEFSQVWARALAKAEASLSDCIEQHLLNIIDTIDFLSWYWWLPS